MTKIILEYDKITGQIKDANGLYAGMMIGLISFEEQKPENLDTIKTLTRQGIDPEGIIALFKAKIL